MSAVVSEVRFLLSAWAASLRGALEYRAAFLAQAGFMLLNNVIFLCFWAVFFARFPRVRGFGLADIALLYAVAASAFGLAVVLFGGCHRLAQRIAKGQLDTWLVRPRPVFLQASSEKMILSGFGDLTSGVLLLVLSANLTPTRIAVYILVTITGAIVLCSFQTLCNSAAFFIGNAEDLATQGIYSLVTMALYPPSLFSGRARLVLYVLVPAGLLSYTPMALVRSWSWREAGLLYVGVAALVAVTALVWRAGLRRYESGNLTQAAQV